MRAEFLFVKLKTQSLALSRGSTSVHTTIRQCLVPLKTTKLFSSKIINVHSSANTIVLSSYPVNACFAAKNQESSFPGKNLIRRDGPRGLN